MKGWVVLIAALLVGCAEVRTLEELEFIAIQTDDWSAVERRERAMARRARQSGPSCPSGAVAVCENRGREKKCYCASRDSIRELFEGF